MLSYIFSPVVVNTYPNTYADVWLMFNIMYRLVYIYRHIVSWINTMQTHNHDRIYGLIYIYWHISNTVVELL